MSSKLFADSRRRRSRIRFVKLVESLEHRQLLASPLVITKGGTYSGTWESTDRHTPAVLINTAEPVVIQNSTVRGPGDLITSGVDHVHLTVLNTSGYGVNPNVYGKTVGRFILLDHFDDADIHNNYIQGTLGIKMISYAGDHTAAETVKVVGNKALNIDGRKSDGAGGWLDFNTRTNKATGASEDGYEYAQFLQFDKVQGVAGIDIGWNEVVNEAGNSRVEDNISIYESSGTSANPISIHDNYIQGAYTVKPWQGDTSDGTYDYDWGYSGGGIMLGDGVGSTAAQDPSFVKAFNNTVISTTNYGIAISAGHDNEFYNNRIFSAGVTPDGKTIANQNTGAYVWDSYHAGSSHFFNDSGHDNTIGWMKGSSRNDWWTNVSSTMPNNIHWSGTVTTATEVAEHTAWQARLAAHDSGGSGSDSGGGVTHDPTPPPPPIPPPAVPVPPPTPPTTPIDPPIDNSGGGPTDLPPIDFPPVDDPPPVPPVDDDPVEPIDFSGSVYHDKDGDGVRDLGENGLAVRTVYVDTNGNKKLDAGETKAITDSLGHYSLSLTPGQYTLREVVPAGWYAPPGAAAREVGISDAGDVSGVTNFGATKYGRISGSVFKDSNRNHIRDAGETGLAGATAFIDANNNGWIDPGERTLKTGADGKWTFGNLKAGNVIIRIRPADKTMLRTTASYFKHKVASGSTFSGKDNFGYA